MTKEIGYTIDKWEGGDKITNHPLDHGGVTKFGIAQNMHPEVDVANLTREGAIAWYEKNFWNPLSCGEIRSTRLRWKVFDVAVNLGPGRSAKFLQRAIGLPDDGIIGPKTLQRANMILISAIGEKDLLWKMIESQMGHYCKRVIAEPSQLVFLEGWRRRAFDIGNGVLA